MEEESIQTVLYTSVLNSSIIVIAMSVLLEWWQQNVCIVGSAMLWALISQKISLMRVIRGKCCKQVFDKNKRCSMYIQTCTILIKRFAVIQGNFFRGINKTPFIFILKRSRTRSPVYSSARHNWNFMLRHGQHKD